jgi:uncharacterized protein
MGEVLARSKRDRGLPLPGARVLLTGASSGIGRELAVQLAAQGATLVVAARRAELLETLAEEIAAAGHPRPTVIPADLAEPGAAQQLVRRALEVFGGGLDVVINNAGGGIVGALAVVGDSPTARGIFEVNFWSPLAVAAAAVPVMMEAGSGTIVNVTSTMQALPLPLLSYYASSKAALGLATESMRLELADSPIRVLEVAPGATDTAARDLGIDEVPWKTSPPRMPPPVSARDLAAKIVAALQRGDARLIYPATSRVLLNMPAVGRLIARAASRRVNTRRALAMHLERDSGAAE